MTTTPTPRTDAFLAQFSGSSTHLSDFARNLERENAALRVALRELVVVQDIAVALNNHCDPMRDPTFSARMVEYSRRNLPAWIAARALVEPQ